MKKLLLLSVFAGFSYLAMAQWQQTTGLRNNPINCMIGNDSSLFVGTGSGVLKTNNNGTT